MMPVVPFFAAMLKVRLSCMGEFVGTNPTFTGVRFYRARPRRKQGSSVTRSFPVPQES